MSFNEVSSSPESSQAKIANPTIISHCFTDVDQLTEFFTYNQIKTRQLSCGSFKSQFLVIQIGQLYITQGQANQALQIWGQKYTPYLEFEIIWMAEGGNLYAHGQPLCPQTDLFGFDLQRETSLVAPPVSMISTLFIPIDIFQACASQMQRFDLDDRFLATNHVSILPDQMNQIKDYLRQLFWLVEHNPGWLDQPHVPELVTQDIVPLVIQTIPIKHKAKPSLKPSRRTKLMAKAQQEVLTHLEKPLTLTELAQRLGSSSSALSYGFQDLFNMSPMRYLKVQRLNAVRRSLKASDPEIHSVEALANQFGFWSAGHFARDYKTMFGELPSETLNQRH